MNLEITYLRRKSRAVHVGTVPIGGGNPVGVQSMITEETHNVPAAVEQIIAMHKAGSEIVRVTTPTIREARCLADIRAELKSRYQDVPLVADVHHQGSDIAVEVARYVDKVRINPGLFVFRKPVQRTEDYSKIPPTITENVEVKLDLYAEGCYKIMEEDLLLMLNSETQIVALTAATLVTKLQQITSGCVYETRDEFATGPKPSQNSALPITDNAPSDNPWKLFSQ